MINVDGGKVKRELPRVLTPTEIDDPNLKNKNIKKFDIPKKTKLEEIIDEALAKRDQLVTDLLDLDDKYDALERMVQDQIKNMNIPVTNRLVRQAVREFGGDDTITAEIYNKAKKTIESINTVMGLNPLHVPFAKKTDNGKALTQYYGDILKNCKDIDWLNFPNKKIYEKKDTKPFEVSDPNEDGIGAAGTNADGSALTAISDLINKAKIDIINFLQFKLFWEIIYNMFLKKIILYPLKQLTSILKPWRNVWVIGKFVKPLYCYVMKTINWFDKIPTILGIRPPPIGGDASITGGLNELLK